MSTKDVNDTNTIQVVHSLISILKKSKQEKTILFYDLYRKYFHITAVPPLMDFNSPGSRFVQVNTIQALEYLKSTYGFYSKEERIEVLHEEAKEFLKTKEK